MRPGADAALLDGCPHEAHERTVRRRFVSSPSHARSDSTAAAKLPDTKASRGETVPLRRLGEAADLAGPAVFLASDDAAYVTGTMLVVDGGMLAQQRSPQVDIFPLSKYPNLPPR